MANVINITNKLNNEPTFIVLGENKQYKVNNNYKTLMAATALLEGEGSDNAEAIMKAIELILGKQARREIEEMSIENILVIFKAVMAAAQGVKYEDAEERFQHETETAE